ncbi:ribonuclease H1-like [Belonocnema kinseyi]|uniref:ribonuclease H1-like n=1 Tax=Belonocnema kinseyi TaxID=2817044 RepID=UPI00143DD8D8|nr:ribonuclease H1-like [Belonocnema kinseyi]
MLTSAEPTLVPQVEKAAPECAPPYLHIPWFPTLCSKTTDVCIDGACAYNSEGEPERGVGVWFGRDHPSNTSKPAQGRQNNNSAEIQAATDAAQKALEKGIGKLSIFIGSKFLIDSFPRGHRQY